MVYRVFWGLYIIFYFYGFQQLIYADRFSLPQWAGLFGRLLVFIGLIAYVLNKRVFVGKFWASVFLLILLYFCILIVMSALVAQSKLTELLTFTPALYALFAYAYRSPEIWSRASDAL